VTRESVALCQDRDEFVGRRVLMTEDCVRSLWADALPGEPRPRPALPGDLDVDVAVVGAGYTGLWTAYYLSRADPSLRIAVLEAETAGFGASGRNGGWCSALFAAGRRSIARTSTAEGVRALDAAMRDTVDEVGRVAEREQLDVDYAKGGTLAVATRPEHVARLRAGVEEEHRWGATEHDARWLVPAEAAERLRTAPCLGAAYTPHCAALHPAKLVRGLAEVVVGRGVRLYEQTRALELLPGRVRTGYGTVRAEVVVRATEGYTAGLRGHRRTLAPLYSLMIATEPLPAAFWDEVGCRRRETFTDGRHLLVYGQRTADDRIAFGGRGAPYHFGSAVSPAHDREPAVFAGLERTLRGLFPALGDAAVTHRWGGPLGVPRDWFSSVGLDRRTGTAWAGGYVGDGVATSNLAGRTLADLVVGEPSELVRLPWVQHRSRRWEPEPLRWLGINGMLRVMASADRAEQRTGRPARRAAWADALIGR
jgi:glycine/D-amino acid oxidase-like deaminating enzyme